MLTSEQGMSLHGEHIAEHRVLAKGSNRGNTQEEPTSSPNTLIKSKVSRAPRTGSASALESSNIQPSSTTFPMSVWVGQRPPKNSRSRRVKVVSPASRNIEVQVSSEGCITSDFNVKPSSAGNNGFQHASSVDKIDDISSAFGLSESEESGAGENKIKKKVMNGSDFAMAVDKGGASVFQMKNNKISTDESGDTKWKEFIISNSWPPLWREKSENVPTMKPVQDMKPNDKSRTSSSSFLKKKLLKYGRPPSKKQKERKILTRVGKQLNIISPDLEFYISLVWWLILCRPWLFGSIFASISLDDASYLKQQVNIAEEFDKKSLSPMFGIDHDLLGVVINNKSTQGSEERKRSHCDEESTKFDALGGKKDMERLDKLTPLFQRLLCALIEQDESQESYDQVMQRIYLDNVLVIILTMVLVIKLILNPKIEIEWILKLNQRYPTTSSSLQSTGVWQGDEEFCLLDITHTSETCSNDLDQLQPTELTVPSFPCCDGHYQLMPLDEKLLLELQSIALYPEILVGFYFKYGIAIITFIWSLLHSWPYSLNLLWLVQPDLAEEVEAINQDSVKLEKALYEQMCIERISPDSIDHIYLIGLKIGPFLYHYPLF
ncbi:hypothetical protein HKD37_14G040567 [Glycine soja]